MSGQDRALKPDSQFIKFMIKFLSWLTGIEIVLAPEMDVNVTTEIITSN